MYARSSIDLACLYQAAPNGGLFASQTGRKVNKHDIGAAHARLSREPVNSYLGRQEGTKLSSFRLDVAMLGHFHRPRILRMTSASRALFSTALPTPVTPSVNAGAKTDPGKWTPQSKRVGLIARKRGMKSLFDEFGAKVPVTVLQVRPFAPLRTSFVARVSSRRELNVINEIIYAVGRG